MLFLLINVYDTLGHTRALETKEMAMAVGE